MVMRRVCALALLVLSGLLLLPPLAWAVDPIAGRGEIMALLGMVEQCGCAFLRNGTWHTSADARKLLEHKYKEALRDPSSIASSEHFINKLASRSGMTGKPYRVRCGNAQAVESGPWLLGKLAELRAAAAKQPPPR